MKANFRNWLFEGMDARKHSNKYWTANRVSSDESKIIVKVADSHVIATQYGYAIILDSSHVVFVKDWAVDSNWYGTEVMLTKRYFSVKKWGSHDDFMENEENLNWDAWLNVAKEQQAHDNLARWTV